jgi:signal peptidase I
MTVVIVAAATLLAASALAARRLLIVITVDGPSMEPTLRSGEQVLIRRTHRLRRGQVVIMRLPAKSGRPPDPQLLLKRVVAVSGDHLPDGWASPDLHGIGGSRVPPGCYVVLGDNQPVSTDSRYFGLVPRDLVVGVMLRRMIGTGGLSPAPPASSGGLSPASEHLVRPAGPSGRRGVRALTAECRRCR